MSSSQLHSTHNGTKKQYVDRYSYNASPNSNYNINTGKSNNNRYSSSNSSYKQHKINNTGFTSNAIRNGLVRSVSKSVESEHTTDDVAPWKLIDNV